MRAGLFGFLMNLDLLERVVALAQRLKNSAVFIHLVQTGEKLAGDMLELLFLGTA